MNKIKLVFPALVTCLIMLCGAGYADKVAYIEIVKTDFSIMSAANFNCEAFEQTLSIPIKKVVIKDADSIQMIMLQIGKASEKKGKLSMDTRGKIIVHYTSGKMATLCIGTTVKFIYNNRLMYFADRRLIEIVSAIPMDEDW